MQVTNACVRLMMLDVRKYASNLCLRQGGQLRDEIKFKLRRAAIQVEMWQGGQQAVAA